MVLSSSLRHAAFFGIGALCATATTVITTIVERLGGALARDFSPAMVWSDLELSLIWGAVVGLALVAFGRSKRPGVWCYLAVQSLYLAGGAALWIVALPQAAGGPMPAAFWGAVIPLVALALPTVWLAVRVRDSAFPRWS